MYSPEDTIFSNIINPYEVRVDDNGPDPDGKPISIIEMPKGVGDLLVHFLVDHPELQTSKHYKSCTGPNECIYTVRGKAKLEGTRDTIDVCLRITQKGDVLDIQIELKDYE